MGCHKLRDINEFISWLQCTCIDPKNLGDPPKAACGALKYKGDGNCDDENNNKKCGYDGGDCCAKTVEGGVVKKDYCEEVSDTFWQIVCIFACKHVTPVTPRITLAVAVQVH